MARKMVGHIGVRIESLCELLIMKKENEKNPQAFIHNAGL